MKLSVVLAPLIAAKAPHDQILAVILAYESEQGKALDQRRKSDAERQARKRDRDAQSRDITLRHSDRFLTGEPAHVEDKTLTSEIEPQKEEKKETREIALSSGFDKFWDAYPNKVGKPKARSSFDTAMRRADLDAIMAGLARYVASKPEDRAWLNPTTFLNQDRWSDQPAPMARHGPSPRINPTLEAARNLMDKLNAVPSEIEGNHPPPRLMVVGNR